MSAPSEGDVFPPPLARWIEPWMDALIIGLPPKGLNCQAQAIPKLLPREKKRVRAHDFIAWLAPEDSDPGASLAASLSPLLARLRAGGLLAVISCRDPAPGDCAWLATGPGSSLIPTATVFLGERSTAQLYRRHCREDEDLVGLRRLLHELEAMPKRLEDALATIDDHHAKAPALTALVARLADRDAQRYRPWLKGEPELPSTERPPSRPLSEELVRFRHFRAQTMEALREALPFCGHEVLCHGRSKLQLLRALCHEEDCGLRQIQSLLGP